MSAKAKSTTSSPKPVATPNPLKSELGTSRNTSRSPKSRNSNRSPNSKRSPSPNKSKLKKDSIHDEVPIEENKTTVEEDEFETEENKLTNPIVEEQPEVEEPLVNPCF